MDNEQLVARIRAGENVAENMLQLWQQNKGFIAKLAKKYRGYAEMDDLMQEGYIGLCNAVDKYDLEADYKFLTCASFHIRRAMILFVLRSRSVKIPEEWNTKLNKYNKFMDEHYKATGCEPSAIRIRAFTHLDEEDVAKLKEIEKMRQIGSLDAPIVGAEDSTLSELVASDQDLEGDVIERFDREQAYASLRESIEKLPDNEQAVLYMRFYNRDKVKDIAEALGVAMNTVKTYERRAMRRLWQQESRPWHKYYTDKYLKPVTFRHVGVREFQSTWTSEVEREGIRRYEKSRGLS